MKTNKLSANGFILFVGTAVLVLASLVLWRLAFQAPGDVLDHDVVDLSLYGISSVSNSVDVIGDLDDDGVLDLIVGDQSDPGGVNSNGAVSILFMNANGTVKSYQVIYEGVAGFNYTFTATSQDFGRSVAGIGDFDGDGVEDVLVSVARSNTGGTYIGEVFLMYLNTDGTVKDYEAYNVNTPALSTLIFTRDQLGTVGSLGDVNGDGVQDFIFGVLKGGISRFYDEGAVIIALMNADGTIASAQKFTTDDLPHINGDQLAVDVDGIGDLDGDGVPDAVVSANADDAGGSNAGAVYVLFLNSDGTLKDYSKIAMGTGDLADFSATAVNDLFGMSVASAGDINGDGVNDLFVGARTDDGAYAGNGSVLTLFMDTDGTLNDTTPYVEYQLSDLGYNPSASNITGAAFGTATAAGDFNSDGLIDFTTVANGKAPRQLYTLYLDGAPADSTAPTPGSSGTITKTGDTQTSVSLSWTAATDDVSAADALTYSVYYAADGTDLSTVENAEGNGTLSQSTANITTATISGLTGETDYEFQVVVADEAGNKAVYTALGATSGAIPDVTAPTVGGSGVVTVDAADVNTLTLSWTAATDAKTAQGSLVYKVYIAQGTSETVDLTTVENAVANGTLAATITGTSGGTLEDLDANTQYTINITVTDASDNVAAYTQFDTATISAAKAKPKKPENTSVLLNGGATCTNTREISVTLQGNNVDRIVLSDNNRFIGSFWEFFSGSPMQRSWTLLDKEGEQSIYVVFRSWYGRKSYIHESTISYEPNNPDCEALAIEIDEDVATDYNDIDEDIDLIEDTGDTDEADTTDETDTTGTEDTTGETDTTEDTTTDTTDTTEDTTEPDVVEDVVDTTNDQNTNTQITGNDPTEAVKGYLKVGDLVVRKNGRQYAYVMNGERYTIVNDVIKSWKYVYPELQATIIDDTQWSLLNANTSVQPVKAPELHVYVSKGNYYWLVDSGNPLQPIAYEITDRQILRRTLGRSWQKYVDRLSTKQAKNLTVIKAISNDADFSDLISGASIISPSELRQVQL